MEIQQASRRRNAAEKRFTASTTIIVALKMVYALARKESRNGFDCLCE